MNAPISNGGPDQAENEALAAFVDFYLNDAIDSVGEVGYVDLADADLEDTRTRWDERTVGAK